MKSKLSVFFALVATGLFYAGWWNSSILSYLDYKIYDKLSSSAPLPDSHATVMVQIDEKSLRELGQWPWPRIITSELLNKVAEGKPAAIAADVVFSEPDRTSPVSLSNFYHDFFQLQVSVHGLPHALQDNDEILARSIQNHRVVLPVFSNPDPAVKKECRTECGVAIEKSISKDKFYSTTELLSNLPLLQQSAGAIGHIHASADKDGIMRRIPLMIAYKDTLIPTLGLSTITSVDPHIALKHSNPFRGDIMVEAANHRFSVDDKTDVLLRFYPESWYTSVSAYDVISGSYDVKKLQGKFVFIGSAAFGLDNWYTLSDGTMRPGIFANVTFMENFFNNDLGVQPSIYPKLNLLASFLIAATMMVFMFRKKYLYIILLFFTVVLLYTLMSIGGMAKHIYISSGYFIVPLISYLLVLSIILFFIDYRNKRKFFEEIQRANARSQVLEENLDLSKIEIERQKELMFQQSKLAAMGEMIGNIAHQWRQPLNTLSLVVGNLEDAYEYGELTQESMRHSTGQIYTLINKMSTTIDDFRNFFSPEKKVQDFSPKKVIEETMGLLEAAFVHNKIVISFDSSEDVEIKGYKNEFSQVCMNIINNAKDALISNHIQSPSIHITEEVTDASIIIRIKDNGGGIPEEIIGRIFEPYFTTKENGKGTGIGLYMSKTIIEEHMGGRLSVENDHEGAVFIITLPKTDETIV